MNTLKEKTKISFPKKLGKLPAQMQEDIIFIQSSPDQSSAIALLNQYSIDEAKTKLEM